MRASMDYWGPDGSSLWLIDNIGLGHLQLHNTPESRYEALPRQDAGSRFALTSHARLDNRAELFRLLGIPASEHSTIPDSELILRAYVRWGAACVERLNGDWGFALWDQHERKLFLARDHHGVCGIYFQCQPGSFAFASALKGLLAGVTTSPRPNLFRLAQVLTSWPGDGVQTAYEEIFRLPPAHTLTVTNGKVETGRYWSPQELPPIRLKTDDEYIEAFLEVYSEAVRCRLRCSRPVGATLSGGLDSGSVCALAARELRASGECLPVFTSVPVHPTERVTGPSRFGDESLLVEADRQSIGNLDLHYVRAEDFSPLAGIERYLRLHDEPGHAAGNAYWIHALLREAQRLGLGALLTGQGGNGTISWSGGKREVESFWPLVWSREWSKLSRQLEGSGLTSWKSIKHYLLRPIISRLREKAARYRYLGRERWEEYSAINLKLARSLDLTRRMTANGHDPFFTMLKDPVQARVQLILPGADVVGTLLAEDGAGYGLELRDPTIDKRLMEFCLALPNDQYRRNGTDRSLIRSAMVGLLPDQVRLNRRRGVQAADLGYRLLATLPEVQRTMALLNQSDQVREVLDIPKMNWVLEALQREVNETTTEQSVTILTRGMMVGMFLLRF